MLEAIEGLRVLVTGGAGFIGSHTCDYLLEHGAEILVLDHPDGRNLANLAHLNGRQLEVEGRDVTEEGNLMWAVGAFRPDAIIHLAALVSVQESIDNPALNFKRNVEATHLLIDAVRQHRVGRIVYASSAAVYGEPQKLPVSENAEKKPMSPYGAAKLASEYLLAAASRCYGFSCISYRYFNVFGARQDPGSPYSGVISIFLKQFAAGRPVTIFGDGSQTRDFIYVKDVARANALAASAPLEGPHSMNLCRGQAISLARLVGEFQRHFPGAPAPCYEPFRPGDILHSEGDPRLVKRKLGYSALTPLEEGLDQFIHSAVIASP
ncbi:MAG: NAD-dependent epimerase/dehydratase family protein [Opitutales bacterium]